MPFWWPLAGCKAPTTPLCLHAHLGTTPAAKATPLARRRAAFACSTTCVSPPHTPRHGTQTPSAGWQWWIWCVFPWLLFFVLLLSRVHHVCCVCCVWYTAVFYLAQDVHHGNGTEAIANSLDFLFFGSVHMKLGTEEDTGCGAFYPGPAMGGAAVSSRIVNVTVGASPKKAAAAAAAAAAATAAAVAEATAATAAATSHAASGAGAGAGAGAGGGGGGGVDGGRSVAGGAGAGAGDAADDAAAAAAAAVAAAEAAAEAEDRSAKPAPVDGDAAARCFNSVDKMAAGHIDTTLLDVVAARPAASADMLMGPPGFRSAFMDVLLPQLFRFKPDFIIVSAGFDGVATDPLGGDMGLHPTDHLWAAEQLAAAAEHLCDGRIVSVLEGGYDVSETAGLPKCVEAHVRGLSAAPAVPEALAAQRLPPVPARQPRAAPVAPPPAPMAPPTAVAPIPPQPTPTPAAAVASPAATLQQQQQQHMYQQPQQQQQHLLQQQQHHFQQHGMPPLHSGYPTAAVGHSMPPPPPPHAHPGLSAPTSAAASAVAPSTLQHFAPAQVYHGGVPYQAGPPPAHPHAQSHAPVAVSAPHMAAPAPVPAAAGQPEPSGGSVPFLSFSGPLQQHTPAPAPVPAPAPALLAHAAAAATQGHHAVPLPTSAPVASAASAPAPATTTTPPSQ